MRFKISKAVDSIKRYIQKKAYAFASFSISNFGYYPGILDYFISKNNFRINGFKFYSTNEVKIRVQEMLMRINSSQAKNLPTNSLFSTKTPIQQKRLAFLTIGNTESITNKVLLDIGNSYNGEVIFVNQEFHRDKSRSKVYLDSSFKLLSDFNPDVIFFELHTLMNSESDNTLFSKDFIKDTKERLGSKICVICFDIWREFDLSYLEYWSDLVDSFVHIDQKAASIVDRIYPMFFWPYPALSSSLPERQHKDYGIFFQGSIREYDRRKLLSHVARLSKKYEISFKFNIFPHHTGKNTPSRAKYLGDLARAKYCIGLSQKSRDHWLITFRSIEAIYSGAILLQQTGVDFDPLSILYKPFEHYLPFKNDLDLQAILFIIKNHEEKIEILSEKASTYHRLSYNSPHLWKILLEELFKL